MHEETCVFDKEIINFKLLALFNTLADSDKDIVIKMAELLVQIGVLEYQKRKSNNIDYKTEE